MCKRKEKKNSVLVISTLSQLLKTKVADSNFASLKLFSRITMRKNCSFCSSRMTTSSQFFPVTYATRLLTGVLSKARILRVGLAEFRISLLMFLSIVDPYEKNCTFLKWENFPNLWREVVFGENTLQVILN